MIELVCCCRHIVCMQVSCSAYIESIRQTLGSLFNSYYWKTYAETYEHYPDEELTRQSRKLETSSRRRRPAHQVDGVVRGLRVVEYW